MAYLLVFGSILIAIILGLWIDIRQRREASKLFEREIELLKSEYAEVFECPDNFKYFTNGHPYAWVSTDFKSVQRKIKGLCRGFRGNHTKPTYSFKVCIKDKKVYFVPLSKDYDFGKLKHCEELVKTNNGTNFKNS